MPVELISRYYASIEIEVVLFFTFSSRHTVDETSSTLKVKSLYFKDLKKKKKSTDDYFLSKSSVHDSALPCALRPFTLELCRMYVFPWKPKDENNKLHVKGEDGGEKGRPGSRNSSPLEKGKGEIKITAINCRFLIVYNSLSGNPICPNRNITRLKTLSLEINSGTVLIHPGIHQEKTPFARTIRSRSQRRDSPQIKVATLSTPLPA